MPGALEVGVFAWLVAPILIVTYLSRTGRYETAHILSSLSLTVLAGTLALFTGGIGSFAAIWLVVVPLEAALSASRRVIVLAALFTLTAASLLLALGFAGGCPRPGAGSERIASPRSALSRRRSTRPALRWALNSSPAPVSGCCTPKKTATGCSPAT